MIQHSYVSTHAKWQITCYLSILISPVCLRLVSLTWYCRITFVQRNYGDYSVAFANQFRLSTDVAMIQYLSGWVECCPSRGWQSRVPGSGGWDAGATRTGISGHWRSGGFVSISRWLFAHVWTAFKWNRLIGSDGRTCVTVLAAAESIITTEAGSLQEDVLTDGVIAAASHPHGDHAVAMYPVNVCRKLRSRRSCSSLTLN